MDADSRQNMEDTEVLKTAESVKTGESAETGAVSAGEITLSLIRDAYPRSLMRSLEEARFTVTERYPGIYYLGRPGDEEGDEGLKFPYPTQIVVTGRLKPETHSGLRILRRPADRADILRFLEEARRESEPVDVRNVNAILGASVPANADLYARIRRESDMLYPALKELMKEDLEERWNAGLQRGERLGLEKGERLGLEKGERLGLQKGIIGAVGIYRDELGLDDRTITDKIAKRFQLTNEQAARYISAQGM